MAGQLLYETLEGAVEWGEGDRKRAKAHLIDVAENLGDRGDGRRGRRSQPLAGGQGACDRSLLNEVKPPDVTTWLASLERPCQPGDA